MVMPALRRGIKRALLREQIARSLNDLIAAGLLKMGDELPPERELAAMLEVSRESLRGGLQLLSDRGVLEIGQDMRTRVRSALAANEAVQLLGVQDAEFPDSAVLDSRLILEPALARLAVKHIDDATLYRLQKLVEPSTALATIPCVSSSRTESFIWQSFNRPKIQCWPALQPRLTAMPTIIAAS